MKRFIRYINQETLDIPVEKKWVGPEAEQATLMLLADGEYQESIVLNGSTRWKHTFESLRKYDETDGHEIVYTLK